MSSDRNETQMALAGTFNRKETAAVDGFGTEKVIVKEEYVEKPKVSYTLAPIVNKAKKRKHIFEELQKAKQTFYTNEEKRASERHELQMKELHLKLDLLRYELELKKLKIEKRI